jgi:hypothetical protein
MAIETERFQVVMTGAATDSRAILLDTATGRCWLARGPGLDEWRPMRFTADAPAAPVPPKATRAKRGARRSPS